VLLDLEERDLEKLGFSLGHGRKLMRAIEARKLAPGPRQTTPSPEAPAGTTAARDAERRQVTVMFCDLVGSTELANAIDPEDMGALIRRYQDVCAGAIARFDGFLAKFMGSANPLARVYQGLVLQTAFQAMMCRLATRIEFGRRQRLEARGEVGVWPTISGSRALLAPGAVPDDDEARSDSCANFEGRPSAALLERRPR